MTTEVELVKLSALTTIANDLAALTEADRIQTGLDVISANNSVTLALAAKEAAEAAASASGNVLFYDTKSAANDALSMLSEGQIVEVMADESVSGLRTRYRKTSDVYTFKIIVGEANLSTAAALQAIPYSSALVTAHTSGAVSATDGGGGFWVWSSASTATENVGTVIKPTGHSSAGRWLRAYSGPISALWFGVNAAAADNTSALQSALNAGMALGAAVYLPKGTYICTGTVSLTSATGESVSLVGDNMASTIISGTGAGDYVLQLDTTGNVRLENLTLEANSVRTYALQLNKAINLRSKFRNVVLNNPVTAGLYAVCSGTLGTTSVGAMLSASVDNLHCSGGNYGLYTDNVNAFGAVQFNKVRISNTTLAAVYIRNPNNNQHRVSFIGCAFEGNSGKAFDCLGGIMLTIESTHFEGNNRVLGPTYADIAVGGAYNSKTVGMILNITGCYFGSVPSTSYAAWNPAPSQAPRISLETTHTVVLMSGSRFGTTTTKQIALRTGVPTGSTIEISNTTDFPTLIADDPSDLAVTRFNFWPPHTGTVTFSAADTTKAISLAAFPQPNVLYYVFATVNTTTGTPAAGSTTVTVSDRTTTGFNIHLGTAPGTGNTVTVVWQLQRPAFI